MKETLAYIVIGLAMLFIAAGLSYCTNNMAQERCEAKGGQFARSLEAKRSMCLLPKA